MLDDSLLLDDRALVLKPVFTGKYLSEIITTHGTYYSTLSPIKLLNRACLRHHSSKKGRKEAAREILNYQHKIPFLISEEVAVFPTVSSTHPECMWIFNHFFEARAISKEQTELKFRNGTITIVPISIYTVRQQKLKVHMLISHVQNTKRDYQYDNRFFVTNPDLDPPFQPFE